MRKIQQIGATPLSISVYSVEQAPTTLHEKGMLEIIFCLKGSVKFSYAYEEFTLHAGEYISVDKDAYYLHDGNDNICVSLYFDLNRYKEKYSFICDNLFVCEGLAETTMEYPTPQHNQLKGMMIALLKFLMENNTDSSTGSGAENSLDPVAESCAAAAAEKIIDLFVECFDVFFFHVQNLSPSDEQFRRTREINQYIRLHVKEKITVEDVANEFNFTPGYISEFLRKNSVGFREMLAYIRANESEHLLLNTDKTIVEISEECGFSDVKYYYSAFKKWYRCTPKQFRDHYGKVKEENLESLELQDIEGIINNLMTTHYMETFLDI